MAIIDSGLRGVFRYIPTLFKKQKQEDPKAMYFLNKILSRILKKNKRERARLRYGRLVGGRGRHIMSDCGDIERNVSISRGGKPTNDIKGCA